MWGAEDFFLRFGVDGGGFCVVVRWLVGFGVYVYFFCGYIWFERVLYLFYFAVGRE